MSNNNPDVLETGHYIALISFALYMAYLRFDLEWYGLKAILVASAYGVIVYIIDKVISKIKG